MPYRKEGSFVYVKCTQELKKNFSSWPSCQVFKVSEHKKSTNGLTYVWVESNSKGLDPKLVKTATPAQIRQYKKDKKNHAVTYGKDVPKRCMCAFNNPKAH